MYKTVRLAKSNEERVANKMTTLLSDYTLDLEAIGFHLARTAPHLIYSRAAEILEAMIYNKEVTELDRGYYRD